MMINYHYDDDCDRDDHYDDCDDHDELSPEKLMLMTAAIIMICLKV